jgi:hypothetical protein
VVVRCHLHVAAVLGRVSMVMALKGATAAGGNHKASTAAKDKSDGKESKRTGHLVILNKKNPPV